MSSETNIGVDPRLEVIVAIQSSDEVKRDLELICPVCHKVVCDVEPGDSLGVLARTALGHMEDECDGEPW